MRKKFISLLFFVMLIFSTNSFASTKPPCFISGITSVCTNLSYTYSVDLNNTSYTYQWTVVGGTMLSQTANTCTVQWSVAGVGSLSVNIFQNGTSISTCSLLVNVYNNPSPSIIPSFEASCSEDEDPGGEQKKDISSAGREKEDICAKVCENSTVVYRTPNHVGSTYTWQINGLNVLSMTGQNTNVFTVTWGSVSNGTIQVTETNAAGCSKTVYKCLQIIRAPIANFSTTPAHNGSSLTICRNQIVTFKDLSIATSNSPIVSWVWNFGDGTGTTTYSAGSTVSHQYTNYTGGTPYVATLTVKNACGCENTFKIEVNVRKFDVPKLICPPVVCCGKPTKYSIKHAEDEEDGCGYTWSVTGGTLLSPASGVMADEAIINWDCSSTPKTIILTPMGCNRCNDPIVYNVGVIYQNVAISGKTIVCPSSEETYSIPPMPGCNFVWSLSDPVAGEVFAGAETNTIKVRWDPNYNGDVTLIVTYDNPALGCGGNGSLTISLRPALQINSSPSSSICAGNSITFSSINEFGGVVNATWQINQLPSGNNVYNNPSPINTISYLFATGGDYEIVATDNSGSTCNSPVKIVRTITAVPPAHTGTVSGPVSNLCPGQTYMYTTTPTSSDYNLIWDASPNGTVNPTSGNKVNIVWNSAGTIRIYQVSKTNPACTSLVRTINVTMVPPPPCTITGNFSACPNSTFTYSAATGYSNYNWSISPASAGSIITGQGTSSIQVQWHNTNVNVSATLNVGIQYCGNLTQNCTSSPINISNSIIIGIAPGNASICQNSSQLFNVVSSGTIASNNSVTWNWGDGTANTVGTALTAPHTYTIPGTYTITVVIQQPNGCIGAVATASTTVTVNSRPSVVISLGGTGKIKLTPCPGDDPNILPATLIATIIAGSCNGGNYQWYKNNVSIPGATTSSYSPSWPATPGVDVYKFEYTCSGIPCGTAVSQSVLIIREATCNQCQLAGVPNHTLTWSETPNVTCGSGTLSYSAPSPGFATRLDFDDNTPPVLMPPLNPNSGNQIHTYTKAGIYYPILYTKYPSTTSGQYCDVLITKQVIIPVIAKTTVSVVCNPSGGYNIVVTDVSDRLTSYATTLRQVQLGSNAPVNMSSTSHTFTSIPSGNYTITFTITVTSGSHNYTCSVLSQAILPVLSVPSINMNASSPRCVGAPVQFTTNATNVASYLWQFGDTTSSLLPNPTHEYTAAFSPATISLQITTNEGCVVTNNTTLNVVPNNLSASITSPSGASPVSICQGGTGPLLNASFGGNTGGVNYVWNSSNANNLSTNSSIVTNNQASNTYTVTITDAIGCRRTANPFQVIVKPTPVASIIGRDEYCYGELVQLSAQQGNGYTYQWFVNGLNYGTSPSITINNYVIGNNTVTLTVTSNNCTSTTSITVKINSNPYVYVSPPFNSQLCAGQPNVITATVSGGTAPYSYYWNTVPVQTSNQITAINAGLYQATVIDANGCKTSDRTRVYRVEDFTNFMSGCYEYCNDKKVELVGPKSPSIANSPLPPNTVPYLITYYYQWYKDGNPIPAPDGTNPNYIVDPIPGPYSGSGEYTLSVTSTLPSAGCERNSLNDYQKSFNVTFKECCKTEIKLGEIVCDKFVNGYQTYIITANVYNPYPSGATIVFTAAGGPVYTIPASYNLPNPGWNTVTLYYSNTLISNNQFCITGGTITEKESGKSCDFETNLCLRLPVCEGGGCRRDYTSCECISNRPPPTIKCSIGRPRTGYQYAYNFTVDFNWLCGKASFTVSSACGVFDTFIPDVIVNGANSISSVFYTNQPPGTVCEFYVTITKYASDVVICSFCQKIPVACNRGLAPEGLITTANAKATLPNISIANKQATATTTVKNSIQKNEIVMGSNKNLLLMPNPATGITNVSYKFTNNSNNNIIISDVLGKTIRAYSNLPKSGILSIDVSSFSSGTYFVKGLGKEEMLVAKLIVTR